ncbi:MAG: TetR/AcrR family transcriptional regulator [Deltaproteobacteria bacterium]|nr:TetR/AcrR family transcriptional regulator [Deltaproteobacteria bacterium]
MKSAERRAQVLAIAAAVFAEKGYHAAKVDDIVQRARIARGTFYLYFEDKHALFGELIDGLLGRLRTAIRRIDVAAPEPVIEQLRANVRRVVALLFEERALTKIMVSDAVGLDPGFDDKLLSFYGQVRSVLEGSLSEGQRLGLVQPCSPQLAATAVIGSVKEIVYQSIFGRLQVGVEEVVDSLFACYGQSLLR